MSAVQHFDATKQWNESIGTLIIGASLRDIALHIKKFISIVKVF